jgi:hypothetical protein
MIMDKNHLLKKLSLMICGLSVIILQMHFIGTSIVEYNISPVEKPYIIPLVIFFNCQYIH